VLRHLKTSLVPAVILLSQTGLASSQDCDFYDQSSCIFSDSLSQSTLLKSRTISRVVGDRLAPGAGPAEEGALSYAPVEDGEDPAAGAIAGEAFSLATNGPAMNWNAWLDTSFVYTDRDHPAASYHGPMFVASLGADRTIGEASVLGLLVNYEYVDFDTSYGPGGNLQSDGIGIGAYAGSALTENIVADAMVIFSHLETDVFEFGAPYSYDARRVQAAANLTGYWYRETWRFSPLAGLTYSWEDQDGYSGNPGVTLESAVALAGLQIGHTTFIDDVRTVEPWIGVNGEWEFHSTGTSGAPLDEFDVRVLAGVNTQLSPTVSANIRADVAGIARSDYLVGTIGGQIAVRF